MESIERDNNLNAKQKFWLCFTAVLVAGITVNTLMISHSWINSPTELNINTNHHIESDEYSARMIEAIKDITINSKDISYGEKINCTVMSLYWDSDKRVYIETNSFESSMNCYAVEGFD